MHALNVGALKEVCCSTPILNDILAKTCRSDARNPTR